MLDATPQEPINIDVEQALLGAIMIDNGLLDTVAGIVVPDDFGDPIHRHVYARALALHAEKAAVTPLTLKPFVVDLPSIGDLPVWMYLGRVVAHTPTITGAIGYAEAVRTIAMKRKLHHVGADLMAASSNPEITIAALASEAVASIDQVLALANAGQRQSVSIGDAMFDAIDAIVNNDGSDVFTSGFLDLDKRIGGGWRRKQYSILAGRPSMGKTALAISSMLKTARSGNGVFFLSMEMPTDQISHRALTDLAYSSNRRMTYSEFGANKIGDGDWSMINQAVREFKSLPIQIDDSSSLTAAEIGSRIRAEQKKFAARGQRLSLVMIDHLGFIKASDRYRGSKVNEVTETSAALKGIAKDLDIALVLLSQLNRGTEGRENKRPSMADLRDSGALEQDADVILFPYREAYYLERTKHEAGSQAEIMRQTELEAARNVMEVIVAKSRQGEPGIVSLYCDMGSNAIRDLAR